jgi:REP element-mobilizing transposase RayT
MPRIARVCAEGYPHHITQRGNNKDKTFFDDEDKRFYLDVLQRYKDKYKMKILAYCLMGNHVHVLAMPEKETSLARCRVSALFPTPVSVLFPTFSVLDFKCHPVNLSITV